ncbi:MAG: CocE/NonD family hydrolase [Actinomycetota bacterium]
MKRTLLALIALTAAIIPQAEAAAACVHPYPCGDEWPPGLEGPFALDSVTHVTVPAHDGVALDGYIARPKLPAGVGAPTILTSSPYAGTCTVDPLNGGPDCSPSVDEIFAMSNPSRMYPLDLVHEGYAVALFTVRGTGGSGGCFEFAGPNEQLDQATVVDWIAQQPWSNHTVGMMGLSYHAITSLEAAINAPASLKTVVVSGMLPDIYQISHTPQGATTMLVPYIDPMYTAGVSVLPPVNGNIDGYRDHLAERACPDVAKVMFGNAQGMVTDNRDQAFFDARWLSDRFGEVSSSALIMHGFSDYGPAAFQESAAWATLTNAPKRQVEGPWGHTFPTPNVATFDPTWQHSTWASILTSWLDYWLKGIGPTPEHLNRVDYQARGVWHQSTQWPPAEARNEVLYLNGPALSPAPGTTQRSFLSAPNPANAYVTGRSFGLPVVLWESLCPPVGGAPVDTGLVFLSAPLQQESIIAGNPFAYLRLTSDVPGGIIAANFFYVSPDFSCDPDGQPSGTIRMPGYGAADLRFHAGSLSGSDFPVGTPTNVRMEIADFARELDPGMRIGLFLHYGEVPFEYAGQPYFPQLSVDAAASHIVVPFVTGTLGGAAPGIAYPPRPFLPS